MVDEYLIYLLGYACFYIILGIAFTILMYYFLLTGMMLIDYKEFKKWRKENNCIEMPLNIFKIIKKEDKNYGKEKSK